MALWRSDRGISLGPNMWNSFDFMREKGNTPTLEDVARTVGVSTATVSRVLNSPAKVAEPTRTRVQETIRELGYLPHFGARAMAANRTRTIGAIIPTMENAIFARGIQAFQEALHDQGYTLLVASSSYSPELENEQIRALVARGADGLLLIGHDRDPSVLDFLDQHQIPALAAWSFDQTARLPSVGFDNRAAMMNLAREALALGHRRFGMITAPVATNDRARERAVGIGNVLREAGLDTQSLKIVETAYGIETGAEAFQEVMSGPQKPTLVFCGNDVLAVGALIRAREMGMAVPDDISITGFDDIDLARITVPGLTTVHVPHREMGHRAAQALIELVETGTSCEVVKLATTIRWRGSLGQPSRT